MINILWSISLLLQCSLFANSEPRLLGQQSLLKAFTKEKTTDSEKVSDKGKTSEQHKPSKSEKIADKDKKSEPSKSSDSKKGSDKGKTSEQIKPSKPEKVADKDKKSEQSNPTDPKKGSDNVKNETKNIFDTSLGDKIVKSSKKIQIDEYPDAFNPSLIKFDKGFLLTFRFHPDSVNAPWMSNIGYLILDKDLNMITKPKNLNTQSEKQRLSHSEDARVFSYNDKLYLIFNDERRDVYISELNFEVFDFDYFVDYEFWLSEPKKLFLEGKENQQISQKNWVPFEWNGVLLLSDSINPHVVLSPNLLTGACVVFYQTSKSINWPYGVLRGGTPAQLVDGEYLAFFHSAQATASPSSNNKNIEYTYMGAYTFTSNAPFEITKISGRPLMAKEFYTPSNYDKRVLFPGGFATLGSSIYLAYGKDESEIWVATIEINELKNSLVSVKK